MSASEEIVNNEPAELPPPDTELPPPVVTRTRSGRRVRPPAALLDSQVPSLKTPSLKTPSRRRKSLIQEVPCELDPEVLVSRSVESEEPSLILTKVEVGCPKPAESVKPTNGTSIVPDSPAGPVPEQTAVPKQTAPVPEETAPVPKQTAPVPEETSPVPKQTAPVPKQTAPVPKQTAPVPKQTAPVPKQTSPVPKETAPVTDRPNKTAKKRTHSESSEKREPMIPLGKPKSGRVWKDRNKQRFSALLRDKPLRSTWEKKMEAKREKQLVKTYSLQLKQDKAREKEDKRKRREENLKRKEENERKSEVVQVIRNTTKIKRMKKKQLRKVEKRDTLAVLQRNAPGNPKPAQRNPKPAQRNPKPAQRNPKPAPGNPKSAQRNPKPAQRNPKPAGTGLKGEK